MTYRKPVLSWVLFASLCFSPAAFAEKITVAVAANFTAAAKELAANFEKETGNEVVLSFGSTGKLYTQIKNGAPFQLFLSADSKRPELLEQEGLGVAGTRFTYALGKLVLWSPEAGKVDAEGAVLKTDTEGRISIANPKTAPYGVAAQEVLEKLGLWADMQSRLVKGDNISQTYQFVASKNVAMGFIALAQIALLKEGEKGSVWMIPADYYAPLSQQAILLTKGADSSAAKAFHSFLQSDAAHALIKGYGYDLESK